MVPDTKNIMIVGVDSGDGSDVTAVAVVYIQGEMGIISMITDDCSDVTAVSSVFEIVPRPKIPEPLDIPFYNKKPVKWCRRKQCFGRYGG